MKLIGELTLRSLSFDHEDCQSSIAVLTMATRLLFDDEAPYFSSTVTAASAVSDGIIQQQGLSWRDNTMPDFILPFLLKSMT